MQEHGVKQQRLLVIYYAPGQVFGNFHHLNQEDSDFKVLRALTGSVSSRHRGRERGEV